MLTEDIMIGKLVKHPHPVVVSAVAIRNLVETRLPQAYKSKCLGLFPPLAFS